MGAARKEGWRVIEAGFAPEEPETGVRRKLQTEPTASAAWQAAAPVTSARAIAMLGALILTAGLVALPFEMTRWAAITPVVALALLGTLFTSRRIELRREGVAIVFDEADQQLVAWNDIQSVQRGRFGAIETLVLSLGKRVVRIRLITTNHAGVDAIEVAIRRVVRERND